MSSPKFRVAICGGGVGGLIFAVALSRYPDIQVDIYEAAREFSETGAGIGLWPRTWKILQSLGPGLERDLGRIAIVPPTEIPRVAFTFRKGDQPLGLSFTQLITPGMISLHRPDFQRVILEHLPASCHKHTSKRLVYYLHGPASSSTPPAPIYLHFQDGSTAVCDLLIGADGIKSAVRSCMLRELAQKAQEEGKQEEARQYLAGVHPKWSGASMYRATFTAEALNQQLPGHRVLREPVVYLGKDTQLTVYPIARGTRVNFAATCANFDQENTPFEGPWVENVPSHDLINRFSRWEPEVQALLRCMRTVGRWSMHTVVPLRSYVSGRVGLLGDAAHGMLPYQGAGAGQAIEDAIILSTLLGHSKTTLTTLSHALVIYDTIRRPFSQRVAEKSRENGLLFTLNYPGLRFNRPDDPGEATEMGKLSGIYHRIRRNWEWAWDTTIDEDLNKVKAMLESSLNGS